MAFDLLWELAVCGAHLSGSFQKKYRKKGLLLPAIEAKDAETVSEYLSAFGGYSEEAVLALFYLIAERDYGMLELFLRGNANISAAVKCPLAHGEASVSPFMYYLSLSAKETDSAYYEVLSQMLRSRPYKNAAFSGFVYDAPGPGGSYIGFSCTPEDIAEAKSAHDNGAALKLLSAYLNEP